MQEAIARTRKTENIKIIRTSTREVFNVVEADALGCDIITAPADSLKKLSGLGTKTAAEFSAWRGEIVPRGHAGCRPVALGPGLARPSRATRFERAGFAVTL
ncbi:MAG: hypothetical protein WA743_14240 [Pseudolabrys sp.]|jgi:hypothetical protein